MSYVDRLLAVAVSDGSRGSELYGEVDLPDHDHHHAAGARSVLSATDSGGVSSLAGSGDSASHHSRHEIPACESHLNHQEETRHPSHYMPSHSHALVYESHFCH